MEQTQNQDTYAGFWARASACILDNAITVFAVLEFYNIIREELYYSDYAFGSHATRRMMHLYILLFSLVFNWLYYAGFESSYLKATPGKRLLGIYVTDYAGQRLSFGQATGRHFAKIISGVILGIGYIMAGVTEKGQALHDTIAECLVWKK